MQYTKPDPVRMPLGNGYYGLRLIGIVLLFATITAYARTERFQILKGKGVEVCEAYKRALEQIDFARPPYCDRPVNPSPEWLERECRFRPYADRCKNNSPLHAPEGFPVMKREYLTAEQMWTLYDRVHSLFTSSNQFRRERSLTNRDAPRIIGTVEDLEFEMRLDRRSAWRTDPLPDVDNDGTPDNVVFWRAGECSQDKTVAVPWPVVVDEQMQTIDEARTLELFGKPGTILKPGKPFEYIRTAKALPGSVGVFRYKDKFYIDAWETTLINNKKKTDLDLNVWLRENGQARRLCGYHWIDRGGN